MADVFISYAREDRAKADQIARGLQAMGLDCFWDTEIPPGQTWADYIEDKLSQCKVVIVLWSAHSTGSQWVREEARMGRDAGKLIPAMLDASPAPFGFGEVQAANLSTWRGEANHADWRRFSRAAFIAVKGEGAEPPSAQTEAFGSPPSTAQPRAHAGVEQLSPIGYIQKCLRLFVDGKGRARRAEYWWWVAFVAIASVIAYAIDLGVGGMNPYTNTPNSQLVSGALSIALLAPGVSVLSRRFHDVGLSGWLVAAVLGVYIVGAMMMAAAMPIGAVIVGVTVLVVLVVAIVPSRPGANQYGPNPKGL